MKILNLGFISIDFKREMDIGRPLLDTDSMAALIALEQARVNRSGERFCVVTFKPTAPLGSSAAELRHLMRLLGERVRRVDTPGWLKGQIAVLLTATCPAGAQAFCEGVIKQLPPGLVFNFEIHAYPDTTSGDCTAYQSTDVSLAQSHEKTENRSSARLSESSMRQREDSRATLEVSSLVSQPERRSKRVVDILGATLLLVITLPILVMAGVLVQLRDRGPVFCLQQRLGYLGKPFIMYKLRTMWQRAAESRHSEYLAKLISTNGTLTKLDQEGDARIIPGMGLFRTLGIDELPQLINVIRGDMSLVGPRPCLPYEAQVFDQWHRERFNVRPGLTGLWQVSGKNRTTFRRMMELDVRYAYQGTLLSDLIILLRTPLAVFKLARANPNSNSSREG